MRLVDKKIENLITPIIDAMGYKLWGVELHQSGRRTLLRIYIDLPLGDERKSVSVDDCSLVSKQIGALLDVEGVISQSYDLEVSSPGIERPLFAVEHYQRYLGSIIKVHLRQPEDGQHNFVGKIQAVFDNKIELVVNNKIVTFELANISKAKLSSER